MKIFKKTKKWREAVHGWTPRRIRRETAFPPKILTMEITLACNLNCAMCPRRYQRFPIRSMTFQQFKEVIKKIPSVSMMNFVGLGEPLTHPEFYRMLKFAESKGIDATLSTNGLLLDEKKIERLPENMREIYFSIDSALPEVYKKIRGANLRTVIQNIKKFKKMRNDVKTWIQCVLMRRNADGVDKLVKLAKELDCSISFLHILATTKKEGQQHFHNLENCDEILSQVYEKAKGEGVKITSRPHHPEKIKCIEPWFNPMISVGGDIYPCCYIYTSKVAPTWDEWYAGRAINVPMFQYKVGNLFQTSDFMKIWNGEDLRLLRRVMLSTDSEKDWEKFKESRKNMNNNFLVKNKFQFCRFCLFRWRCAC